MAARFAFGNSLKELRFLFCQTGEGSAAVRAFVQESYPLMKKHYPHTPILIREALGTHPRVFARFEFGKEKQESLAGLSGEEIEAKVSALVKDTT